MTHFLDLSSVPQWSSSSCRLAKARNCDNRRELWKESISLTLDSFPANANLVKNICGCSSICRTKDAVAVGGLDVNPSINEDTGPNSRFQQFSVIIYTPNAIIRHNHQRRELGEFVKRMHIFGYGRGVNRLWDPQVVPPIVPMGIFLMVFTVLSRIYVAVISAYTLVFLAKTRRSEYLFSITVAFVFEYVSHVFRLWIGTIEVISRRGNAMKIYLLPHSYCPLSWEEGKTAGSEAKNRPAEKCQTWQKSLVWKGYSMQNSSKQKTTVRPLWSYIRGGFMKDSYVGEHK